jgi:hypothetical protein
LPGGIFYPNLGKFLSAKKCKLLENVTSIGNFTAIWYSFGPIGILSGFLAYFPRFGILRLEKAGNPAG